MKNDSSENISVARKEMYALLSRAFYVPKEDLLDDFTIRLNDTLGVLRLEIMSEEVRAMEHFLKSTGDVILELGVEYTRLFLGPVKILVYPYESMHREGVVMGESTQDVLKRYNEAGVSIDANFKDLPDHITAEFEFMYFLCSKEIEALASGDLSGVFHYKLLQHSFLLEHIGKWVPGFCNRVISHAKSNFYASIAKIAKEFIAAETGSREELEDLACALRLLNMIEGK